MDYFQIIINLLTLTALEIILGIDNVIFIAIVTNQLPRAKQHSARRLGHGLALLGRYALLLMIMWVVHLNHPLFSLFSKVFTGHDIFIILGGTFLFCKATWEIVGEFNPINKNSKKRKKIISVFYAMVQIVIFDLLFSLDSILTAVGLTQALWIMAVAITIAVLIALSASDFLSRFIHNNPSIKMLALSFLLLIGVELVAEGLGFSIPKAYIYFVMLFSLFLECLNTYRNKRRRMPRP